MTSTSQQRQFGRQCSIVLFQPGKFTQTQKVNPATGSNVPLITANSKSTPEKVLDLSNMHITFRVNQNNTETPNTAHIRVYNLKPETEKMVSSNGEFSYLVLGASYEGEKPQTIFSGTVKQTMAGNEDAVSSFIEIFAADGDIAYDGAVISRASPAGTTQQDQWKAIADAMNVPQGYTMDMTPIASARGVVKWGMARDYARDIATTQNASWSIQNGELVLVSNTSYIPGEAVVLNSQTGLIGFPTQTPNGIQIRCLLNPKIKIGRLVQINNKEVQQAQSGVSPFSPKRLETYPGYLPRIGRNADGFYKALVVEHTGDTRGQPWYTDLTCFLVDKSAPIGSAVRDYYAGGVT